MYTSLGIDVSTKTGIVVAVPGSSKVPEVLHKDEANYPKKKGMERAGLIASRVMHAVNQYDPNQIFIEGYSFASKGSSLTTLVEIGTVIRYFLWQYQKGYIEVAPTSLKKFVTGRGNVKKDIMALETYKRWGLEFATDNITDAFGLAAFGLAMEGYLEMPKVNMSPVQLVAKTLDKTITSN